MDATPLPAALSGFSLGLSLILAIGAQNAFVLRQGIRREHVFAVCLTCALSDALLIAAGVAGFGWVVERLPWIQPVMTWGGAAFLAVYGALSFRRAMGPPEALAAAKTGAGALRPTLLTCLALTWLNPHVYLDTVVLLGSVSAGFEPRTAFASGRDPRQLQLLLLPGLRRPAPRPPVRPARRLARAGCRGGCRHVGACRQARPLLIPA